MSGYETYRKDAQDDCRDGDDDCGENDHAENPPEISGVVHDQIEPGVQNKRLRDNHEPPTQIDEDDGGGEIRQHVKIGQDDGQGLGQDAPGAQHAAPEVETPPAPEEEEEPDVELNGDVKGHAREGRHGHGHGEVLRDIWSAAHGDGYGLAAKLAVVEGEAQEMRVRGRRGHDKTGPPTRIYFAPPQILLRCRHAIWPAPLYEVLRGLLRDMDGPPKILCSRRLQPRRTARFLMRNPPLRYGYTCGWNAEWRVSGRRQGESCTVYACRHTAAPHLHVKGTTRLWRPKLQYSVQTMKADGVLFIDLELDS